MKKIICILFSLSLILSIPLYSQDTMDNSDSSDLSDFDPFASSSDTSDQSSNFSVTVGGSLNVGGTFFLNDFKTFKDTRASSLIWGDLNIKAKAPITEAYFGIKVNDMVLPFNFKNKPQLYPQEPQIPRFIDEAYMQATISNITFGGGLKKITWGKADAFSVLDVINSQNLSDPTISDTQELKFARPMLYLSAYLPKEMKLEVVYLPVFEGNTFAISGRWKPNQFESMGKDMVNTIQNFPAVKKAIEKMMEALNNPMTPPNKKDEIRAALKKLQGMQNIAKNFKPLKIDSASLKYSQVGARYTVTIEGYHDLGVQYYYGFLPNPTFSLNIDTENLDVTKLTPETINNAIKMDYNPYHQIGLDYGLAIGPINLRAEFAANITSDLEGTKPNVYNPNLGWNFGIDYTTPIGLSINLCVAENIKLLHNKIGTRLFDVEKGSNVTDTKIMLLLSQPLLRDSINLKLRTVMACEPVDFMMVPSVDWSFGTLTLKAEFGFFFGKENGPFSQYKDNNYMSLSIGYSF